MTGIEIAIVALIIGLVRWLFSMKSTTSALIESHQQADDPEKSLEIAEEGIRHGASGIAFSIAILLFVVILLGFSAIVEVGQ